MRKILNKTFGHSKLSGYAAIVSVILISTVALLIASGISSLTITKEKIVRNTINSAQSYYTAEAGLEDLLLRVIDVNLNYDTTEALTLAGSTASTSILMSGSDLTIVSEGDKNNFIRNVQVVLSATTQGASFNYGVQVGAGGLKMKNNGIVNGNVYSDGNIIGTNNPQITGDAWVSGPTGTISGFTIGVDAHAHTIDDSTVNGDAYYQSILSSTVNGVSYPGSPDPPPVSLPIEQSQIDTWKSDALAGGTTGSYILNSGTASLGPKKIDGDLTIDGDGVLTLTGTIWVTGNVLLKNNGAIQLSSGYGTNSGVLVADGGITIQNNFAICGSEGYNPIPMDCNTSNGSYVLVLSTKVGENAITMKNDSELNGILYTSAGEVEIENNATLKGITAYEIEVENNAIITYESGMVNLNFSSGPGGGWDIGTWEEVE